MAIRKYFRQPALSAGATEIVIKKIQAAAEGLTVTDLQTELCFYVVLDKNSDITIEEEKSLQWIISIPFEEGKLQLKSHLQQTSDSSQLLVEIGPRLNFSTAFSTNAVSICQAVGLQAVQRIEFSTRYLIHLSRPESGQGDGPCYSTAVETAIVSALHDRMTQCRYTKPVESFDLHVKSEPVYEVDVMELGQAALEKANKDLGLAFDSWDLDYYTKLFRETIKRNPTNVECFDLAQSNSEHSRHWFFKGRLVVDGQEVPESLFSMIMDTQTTSNPNNVIKFNDNSSAIKGYKIKTLCPEHPGKPGSFKVHSLERDIIFTAETHNFPTGVAPFPGATTGTGGRIRDVQSTGTGAHVVAGTAGYSFGNLQIPGYKLPWEDSDFMYPGNLASPLDIIIEASNGASDYGNKFGEPVLAGFARSFGLKLASGERREWVKPIMFSAGMGSLEHIHIKKTAAEKGMEVVKLGGPVYRIGVGGGAASSIQVQGDNAEELDFGAVQRGDAEMEQKLNRVIRACIERGDNNPICSIHDQGAGGNGNVLKEIAEPAGAVIRVADFTLGDPTLSTLEVWGAEYQESNALLVQAENIPLLKDISKRERCPVNFVGTITGDGKIRLEDKPQRNEEGSPEHKKMKTIQYPVDLDLEHVLGSMPRKVFKLDHAAPCLKSLELPAGLNIEEALHRVLRLPSVGSKRYLTNKVDRSVTGLVAQQQCVGPLHTPLADVAVTALSYFNTVGSATAIGEQPIKGLVDAGCGARMSVGEALTNLVFAEISSLKDVKCSGNWMWAAKLPGEGAALVDACKAMCGVMKQLGIAVDGGKDSLSMAARVGTETVKAPGSLVISVYAPCPDITSTVTPDLKCPGGTGSLLYIPLGGDKHRLGGSALAQCYGQIGDDSPDLDSTDLFAAAFNATQKLIRERKLTAGHDVSDGGLITAVLEMAFAGNCGLQVTMPESSVNPLALLFAEELGLVLEVAPSDEEYVKQVYKGVNVPCVVIGRSLSHGPQSQVTVTVEDQEVLIDSMWKLRDVWEETSFQLERFQCAHSCVEEEQRGLRTRSHPEYNISFDPNIVQLSDVTQMSEGPSRPRVAVIREEGSNGDREMVAAFLLAGFDVWDVNMNDMCSGSVTLDQFRGVVFVGGFSFADVFGSAKGWAATLRFNKSVRAQFDAFYQRQDTFSLGVCNGCQLMGLLGWVMPDMSDGIRSQGVYLDHNTSERFESRFTTVRLEKSQALMLQGMEGSVLGIWVAHGEGRMVFKNSDIHQTALQQNLAPIRYADDSGQVTSTYPLNPNGSPDGIAAVCSEDGRHLAMMPHPERCVLPWQWPWMPEDWKNKYTVSPWMKMFKNAFDWCKENTV